MGKQGNSHDHKRRATLTLERESSNMDINEQFYLVARSADTFLQLVLKHALDVMVQLYHFRTSLPKMEYAH